MRYLIYLEEPLWRVILRRGNSALRLKKLEELKAPQAIIDSEVALGQKYHRVIYMQSAKFIKLIQKLNTEPSLSNRVILKNIEPFCTVLTEEHNARYDAKLSTRKCQQCGLKFKTLDKTASLCYSCRNPEDLEAGPFERS